MTTLIEVSELHKRFGILHAVNNVSFNVQRGEVLGFLGPNGAGKSTTMKMITGFLEPTGGTIRVAGHDVQDEPIQVKRRIGYLPEGAPSYGEMTVQSFLEFVAEVRGVPRSQRQDRIRDVIDKIHLESVVEQTIETLSKGYKRRVGIAQALLHDPEILILDEPTDGLDPNQKHEVRLLIQEMAADKAIIISTHILEEVDAVCSRAVIIAAGRILFDGTPTELQARSDMHNAVTLIVDPATAAAAETALNGLDDVERVERIAEQGDQVTLLAVPHAGREIITAIGETIHRNNWAVQSLRVESGRLDDVFRQITMPHSTEGQREFSNRAA
ncbi:ABC-2 type transport system ATP-binding protein [Methylohalomonas lacus]|uniref:ABC-2 type transport system ATP-binding protein n=1 Tax=Methylohalomonas lacus TaxID=398773 RepID=A0AAE3L475_9GAMM|nr:ABC-2 type transport system ATP-binding protein [Methylohalomonas lacus]